MSRYALRPYVQAAFLAALSLSLPTLLFAPCAFAREWSDATGKFKIKGEVTSFDGKVVRLAEENGLDLKIPIERLSAADQEYLKKTYPDGKMAPGKGGNAKGGGAAKATSKLEVIGVAVARPVANQSGEEAGLFTPGTHVRLLVSDAERSIVSLDEEKSKVASFTDNKNTNLLGESATATAPFFFEVLPDGKSGLVTIHVPQVPAEKSVRLAVKGELHVVCGLGDDAETVRLPLNLEITLGL